MRCAFPLSILSQLPINVSAPDEGGDRRGPYAAAVKFGLQFSRRFWEEDEHIFGGISYTDLPIRQIAYPSTAITRAARACCSAATCSTDRTPTSSPRWRLPSGCGSPSNTAPSSTRNTGASSKTASRSPGSRVPFTLGCAGEWSDEARKDHYDDLCQIDGRIVLAGEHASYIPAWQEGAILSALDAIARLHKRVVAT